MLISNIKINFSIKLEQESKNSDPLQVYAHVFKAIGLVLSNIEDAPLELNGIHLCD